MQNSTSKTEKYQQAFELWQQDDTKYEAAEMMRNINDQQSIKVAGEWFMVLEEIEEAVKCWKIADEEYSDLTSILKLMEYAISVSDDEEFEKFATKAATQNHPDSIIKLAFHFQSKLVDIPDQDDPAFIWSKKAASCGDPRSMKCLAEWSRDLKNEDSGSDQDETLTLSWYKKAAKTGDVQSICIIAIALFHGIDCKRDVPAALEYFVKASRLAAQPSMHSLGEYYAIGEDGVFEADPARAFDLFYEGTRKSNLASQQGDSDAMKSVGDALYSGIGCERDVDAALEKYESAIKKGSVTALACLAKHYYPVDVEKSRQLFSQFIQEMSDGREIDEKSVDEILENWIAEE
jgi:TPR repeat protein